MAKKDHEIDFLNEQSVPISSWYNIQ